MVEITQTTNIKKKQKQNEPELKDSKKNQRPPQPKSKLKSRLFLLILPSLSSQTLANLKTFESNIIAAGEIIGSSADIAIPTPAPASGNFRFFISFWYKSPNKDLIIPPRDGNGNALKEVGSTSCKKLKSSHWMFSLFTYTRNPPDVDPVVPEFNLDKHFRINGDLANEDESCSSQKFPTVDHAETGSKKIWDRFTSLSDNLDFSLIQDLSNVETVLVKNMMIGNILVEPSNQISNEDAMVVLSGEPKDQKIFDFESLDYPVYVHLDDLNQNWFGGSIINKIKYMEAFSPQGFRINTHGSLRNMKHMESLRLFESQNTSRLCRTFSFDLTFAKTFNFYDLRDGGSRSINSRIEIKGGYTTLIKIKFAVYRSGNNLKFQIQYHKRGKDGGELYEYFKIFDILTDIATFDSNSKFDVIVSTTLCLVSKNKILVGMSANVKDENGVVHVNDYQVFYDDGNLSGNGGDNLKMNELDRGDFRLYLSHSCSENNHVCDTPKYEIYMKSFKIIDGGYSTTRIEGNSLLAGCELEIGSDPKVCLKCSEGYYKGPTGTCVSNPVNPDCLKYDKNGLCIVCNPPKLYSVFPVVSCLNSCPGAPGYNKYSDTRCDACSSEQSASCPCNEYQIQYQDGSTYACKYDIPAGCKIKK